MQATALPKFRLKKTANRTQLELRAFKKELTESAGVYISTRNAQTYLISTLANTTGKIPGNILPANNTLPLFLVGYSAELNNSKLTCVHANYSGRLGNLVNWTLYFNYTDE
ncbi:hypothetical protein MTO96_041470, partial [Rhipicephalus appendiculatus]